MSAAIHRLWCETFGVHFCLAAESNELLKRMESRIPWGTTIGVEARGAGGEFALHWAGGVCRVALDGRVLAERENLHGALDDLARELLLRVAEFAPERVFVHAGVVGWHGSAMVMPGASFAGKTTLVAELVRAGAVYYSDEYAVLDDEGRVRPYARELAMRREGCEEQTAVSAESLGGAAGDGPLPVSHVIFTEYTEGAAWRPEPVSQGTAALEMLRHAVPVQRTPARVMSALAKMLKGAKALRSQRGEAKEAAVAMLEMMSAEERRP